LQIPFVQLKSCRDLKTEAPVEGYGLPISEESDVLSGDSLDGEIKGMPRVHGSKLQNRFLPWQAALLKNFGRPRFSPRKTWDTPVWDHG